MGRFKQRRRFYCTDRVCRHHKNILEPKCANPACHDGTFEPDFRTIEGSYNTLVYHPVTKNDEDLTYEHRVVPGDIRASDV